MTPPRFAEPANHAPARFALDPALASVRGFPPTDPGHPICLARARPPRFAAPVSDPLDSSAIPPELRAALRHSPDNAPLLVHVADTILKTGAYAEAAALFKRALALAPANTTARLGLAAAFFQQGKPGAALVIVEDMVKQPDAPARAWLLHARLSLHAGEPRLAARHYLKARETDPLLTDPTLEQELAPHLPARPVPRPVPRPPAPAPPRPPGADGPHPFSAADPDASASNPFSSEPAREPLPAGELPPSADSGLEPERPALTFADVGGMERVKEEVRMKIILPLRQPELFKAYGKKIGGGILMYGPPGCGKTFLARATAGVGNTPSEIGSAPAARKPRATAATNAAPDARVSRPMSTRPTPAVPRRSPTGSGSAPLAPLLRRRSPVPRSQSTAACANCAAKASLITGPP